MSTTPSPEASQRELDLVLFGATGFTGRLVAEYLAARPGPPLAWAIAGRSQDKLSQLQSELANHGPAGAAARTLVADIADPASMARLAASCRAVITTVGPFARYGEPLVRACVEQGAHYADITGEPAFVSAMMDRYDEPARERGVRIVNCCGFDSIPHDLGALVAVRALPRDQPIVLEGFVQAQGTFSGGTWTSALEGMAGMGKSKGKQGARRKPQPAADGRKVGRVKSRIHYERRLGAWACPLPTIDGSIVRRSARALSDYGPSFRYGHYLRIKTLPRVIRGVTMVGGVALMAQVPILRRWLAQRRPPGEGPSVEQRARSRYRVTFLGRGGGQEVRAEASGGDPGYGETSKMLAETGLALALDGTALPAAAGVLTPAVALGDVLLDRLREAGLRFEVLETGPTGG